MKAEIAGTLVEWDETKNQRNIRKHGISFSAFLQLPAGISPLYFVYEGIGVMDFMSFEIR